jgi:hypothetical protein
MTDTINGTYGSNQTPCTIFTYQIGEHTWYAVEDSQNVNLAPSLLSDGVDVETIQDIDCFNWPDGIDSEETLETAVEA